MRAEDVLEVIDLLEEAGIEYGIGGGWGIDALLGEETRDHADLDLGIAVEDAERAIAELGSVGYRVVLDERPGRIALDAPGGRAVDLHPIRWTADRIGYQETLGHGVFVYPPGSLAAVGMIRGHTVRCATRELQERFHEGYEPRDVDRRDMTRLRERFGFGEARRG